MHETILYQNASKSITVLDLPCSIQYGQKSSASLRSNAAVQVPYPSTEPTGRKREKLLCNIPHVEREYHEGLCELLKSALHEARSHFKDQDWCCARKEQCVPDEVPELVIRDEERLPQPERPPLLLSSIFENYVSALADLQCSLIVNPLPTSAIITAQTQSFVVPPQSAFLCTSVAKGLSLINDALTSTIFSAKPGPISGYFDFVLLDPPWTNRSVRHAKTYRTAETGGDPFNEVSPILKSHVAPCGVVAVWITNKAVIRTHVLHTLSDAGFGLFEELVWLKITSRGQPVTNIDGLWRKPYEVLLLFRRTLNSASAPQRRVVIAVPDFHSRKPCLVQLIEHHLPQPYHALEVFARSLTAGWWSWGDECLRYQHASQWDL